MIYGGDGLARLPATSPADSASEASGRGKAVFVPFVLAGEKIEATLTEQKPGFARGKADAIVEPSAHRVLPGCQYFSRCGGCHYQHASYEHQLEIKKEILRESLRRTGQAGFGIRYRSASLAAVELSQPVAAAGAGQSDLRRGIFQAGVARTAGGGRVPDQFAADQSRDHGPVAKWARRQSSHRRTRSRIFRQRRRFATSD